MSKFSCRNFYRAIPPLAALAWLLGGCASSPSSSNPQSPSPVALSLNATSASVVISATAQFTATVASDAQNRGVTWALSGAGCTGSKCGTLSASTSPSGTAITYTAPATIPSPATVTLIATSVTDVSKSAAATITIAGAAAISVGVSPTSAGVQAPGGTKNFTATVGNDTQSRGVSWALSGGGCMGAACGRLSASTSASGTAITYTAPATVPSPATVTLKAASLTDTAKTASATITLSGGSSGSVSVAITPKRGGLTVSQNLNFTASVSNDVGGAGVTWSASGASCSGAACGTFKNVTATSATFVAGTTKGLVNVTATSAADGSKNASAPIGVTDLAGVFTYHNDLARDGVNAQEYALTIANVASATFGKLFSCAVDGAVYAQPLWVANLTVGGVKHNAVMVVTMHDTVYAFDADASPCKQLWAPKSLLGSGETWVDMNDVSSGDIQPDIGILGTPVIDPATNLLYVIAKSKVSGTNGTPATNCHQRLHAINLLDGSEPVPANDLTTAIAVSGTGDGSSAGTVTFNTLRENQRPGLVLANEVVYAAWASHGDVGPYHGWVVGFDKSTLRIVSVFNANPDGSDTGIWMSGGAPSVDSGGNMYFLTGNGTFDADSGGPDYGDSTVKLSTSGGLSVAGYFTPADQQSLSAGDADHGAGGAAILVDQPSGSPHQHLVIGGGKEGNLFLLNRDNLGGYGGSANPPDSNAVQKFSIGNAIFATAAFWNNSLYIAGIGGPLKAFSFDMTKGQFNTAASSQSGSVNFGFPGATPSVSSSGTTNGIVWALDAHAYCTQQAQSCGSAVLYGFDARNLSSPLWNSGNSAGNAVKFTVPTIANGKVYVGTRGNNQGGDASSTSVAGELDVYGLLPD
jgi:hypothetical protein